MELATVQARLVERFGAAIEAAEATTGDGWLRVAPEAWVEVARFLRDEPELGFDCLSNQSGVDRPAEARLEVVCHLFSYRHRHTLVLKTSVPREEPRLATLQDVWPAANWLEREIYDLLGVEFDGHPDLRRLMMPEDWVGHPLRKDFVEPEEYHGIRTQRPNPLHPEVAS